MLDNQYRRQGRFRVFRSTAGVVAGAQNTHISQSAIDIVCLPGFPLVLKSDLGNRKVRDGSEGHSVRRDETGPFVGRKTVRGFGSNALDNVYYAIYAYNRDAPRW